MASSSTGVRYSTFKKWKHELDPQNTWLKCEESAGNVTSVYCELCRKNVTALRDSRNFNTAFIKGIKDSALKKDNCVKHAKSEMHKHAWNILNKPASIQEFFVKTPVGKAMASVSGETKDRVEKLVDIAYVLAQEEIAFNKFPKLVELEKRHGVEIGETYATVPKCEEFTSCIATTLKNELINDLANADYLTICCDGSTDVSVTEKEIVFVMFINQETCAVEFKYLKITDLPNCSASAIFTSLKEILTEFGVTNFEKKLVGFLADGAAVNFGHIRGVSAELKKLCPWLLAIHCLSHRLELSVKNYIQSTYLTNVFKILGEVHEFYSKSPSRIHQFQELSMVLGEENATSVPTSRVHGVRWVSHKKKCLDVLVRNFNVIVSQLENWATGNNPQAAKLSGILRTMKSAKFVAWVLFFKDILNHLSKLSLVFQSDDIDMLYAMTILKQLYSLLASMKDGNFGEALSGLLKPDVEMEEDGGLTYQGISLSHCSSIEIFKENYNDVLIQLQDVVYKRFSDLHENDLIRHGMKILHDKMWPTDETNLHIYGDDEINFLCTHYKEVLEAKGVTSDGVCEDWQDLKTFWLSNLRHITGNEFWTLICKNYKQHFPNLVHIISILRLFPVSNAKVERAFSTMKRVKSDYRNRLKTETLDNLMRISIEGPEFKNFSSKEATELFFNDKSRRPNTTPYGPRPGTSKE